MSTSGSSLVPSPSVTLGFAASARWVHRLQSAPGPVRAAAAMLHLATVGWLGALIFREPDPSRLIGHLSRPMWAGSGDEWVAGAAMVGVIAAGVGVIVVGRALGRLLRRLDGTVWLLPAQTSCWTLAALFVAIFWRSGAADFLYFRF